MRFLYYVQKNNLPPYEYIITVEPQGRGAWHIHGLFIFNTKAPFIKNKTLSNLWGNGFVKVKGLKNVDNIGAYLTAYLGDMELTEVLGNQKINANSEIKEVTSLDEKGNKTTKYYIKGARLKMFPKGLRIFRKSKGILNPTIEEMTNGEAMELIKADKLTYEKTIELEFEDTDFTYYDDSQKTKARNIINYRYFNRIRRKE
jgi:hypothetical protein